jgi:hypothetical protein
VDDPDGDCAPHGRRWSLLLEGAPPSAGQAIWLAAFAQPLLLHNWVAGPATLAAFALMHAIRTPREEAMMRDRFGAEWDAHVARTRPVLPRLRRRRAD